MIKHQSQVLHGCWKFVAWARNEQNLQINFNIIHLKTITNNHGLNIKGIKGNTENKEKK